MEKETKYEIRYVKKQDIDFWFSLDKHLSKKEFNQKVKNKQGYVLFINNQRIGILRYNLFWDNVPFCTLLYIKQEYQRKGYGKILMNFWEQEMKEKGYTWLLVSTLKIETAQHFYRLIGYVDCGYLLAPGQEKELFLRKNL